MLLTIIYLCVLLICIIATKNYTRGVFYAVSLRLLLPSSVRMIGLGISINSFLTFILFLLFFAKRIYKHKIDKRLFLIFGFYLISSLILIPFAHSVDTFSQIKSIVSFIITDYLLAFFCWYSLRNEKNYISFFNIITTSLFIICIYGIYEYIIGDNPINDWAANTFGQVKNNSDFFLQEKRGIINGRIMGMTFHPLALGLQMGLSFVFLVNNRKYFRSKFTYALLIILVLTNSFLCGSRTSLIIIIIACILYYRFVLKVKLRDKIFLISITIGIFYLTSKSDSIQLFLDTIESSVFFWNQEKSDDIGISGSSVSMRITQLSLAFSLIQDKILAGYGYAYSYIAINISRFADMKGFESIIFKKVIEQGLLGLVFFFSYYWTLLKHSLSFNRYKYETIILFLVYFVGIAFTDYQNTFYLFLIFALIDIKHKYLLNKLENKHHEQ